MRSDEKEYGLLESGAEGGIVKQQCFKEVWLFVFFCFVFLSEAGGKMV